MKQNKKIILSIILAFAMMLQSFTGLFSAIDFSVNASEDSYTKTSLSISNSSFDTDLSGDTNIYASPKDWTSKGDATGVTKGAVLTKSTFDGQTEQNTNITQYGVFNSKVDDDYSLMIYHDETSTVFSGYESSNSITLSSYSYYEITFWAYASDGTVGSIYLVNDDCDTYEMTNSISFVGTTNQVYKEYRLYVKTGLKTEAIKFGLYLGKDTDNKSNGLVLFDNLSGILLSETDYYTRKNDAVATYTKYEIDFTTEISKDITATQFNDASFETGTLVDFANLEKNEENDAGVTEIAEIVSLTTANSYTKTTNSEQQEVDFIPNNANLNGNEKGLLLYTSAESYVSVSTKKSTLEDNIKIETQKLYKLSFLVKTSALTNSGKLYASIALLEEDDDEVSESDTTKKLSIDTSSLTSNTLQNWIRYSFYIKANNIKDSYISLKFSLGDEDTQTSGYAFIDDINMVELNTADYDSYYNSTSYSSYLSLATESTSSSIFRNQYFNQIKISDVNETQTGLKTAKEWTVENKEYDSVASEFKNATTNKNGVINLNPTLFSAQNPYKDDPTYANFVANPGSPYTTYSNETKTSAYLLANVVDGYQKLSNDTAVSLSSSTTYAISFYVATSQNLQHGSVYIMDSDGNSVYRLYNVNTNGVWTKYTIYLTTGSSTKKIYINFNLGTNLNKTTGTMLITNVNIKSSSSIPETLANETNNKEYKISLKNDDFNLHEENINSESVYSPLSWTINNTENTKSGVVTDTTNYLKIVNDTDTDTYYTSIYDYALSATSYYLIKIDVKTSAITNKGAYVKLLGVSEDKVKKDIVSSSEYTTYNFYIYNKTATTLNFVLGLDGIGESYFTNVEYSTSDSSTYTSKTKELENDSEGTITNVIMLGTAPADDDDSDSDNKLDFSWLLWIGTIATGLAVIIVIINALVRKIKFRVPSRHHVLEYDRAKTLVKDHERREQIKIREEKLKALREKLSSIIDEIDKAKEEYRNSDEFFLKVHDLESSRIKQAKIDKEITRDEEKAIKAEVRREVKEQRKKTYEEQRKLLVAKYQEIEKEIDRLLEEEKKMIAEYKAYKKELRQSKKLAKIQKKNAEKTIEQPKEIANADNQEDTTDNN